MHWENIADSNTSFAVTEISSTTSGGVHLVWGHGWGQSAGELAPLAESLKPFAGSSLIDFPGFGQSPKPPDTWGTAEYADLVANWIRTQKYKRIVWIGHSFGGRVGLQLAARHSELISGMVLIASAGLQRRRSLADRMRIGLRKWIFKTARIFLHEGPRLDRLRQRLGSSDYRAAGALRPILTRVVSEDLTDVAKAVRCPTLLIYGTADTDTPPEIGQRFKNLIPRSELVLLNGFGHLSVLSEGRHQVVLQIRKFLELINR